MNALRDMFDKADDEGVEFSQILHLLQREPFGLRQGIIPIVLAIYLHQNRNELMLVNAAGEELPWTAEQIDAAMSDLIQFRIQRFNWSKEKSLLCELLAEVFAEFTDADDIAGQSRRIVKMMKRWMLSLIGTMPSGTVRVGLGWFNSSNEVDELIIAVEQLWQ